MKASINHIQRITGDQDVDVHIDTWDTWSVSRTLSHIIAPLLRAYRNDAFSFSNVEPEDAPDNITEMPERWEYVLNEMIWTFETLAKHRYFVGRTDEEVAQDDERIKTGLALFAKYFKQLYV